MTVNPYPTTISKLTKKKKAFKATWKKKSSQVTGYQLQYSLYSDFSSAKTVKIKKYKTTSKTVSKLKAKKTYYVRVRTYKTVSGKTYYSTWSPSKSVKTK
ncbi:MAG: fibronectin type III domain-containing protein [Erysipelotrichaceae bacterium]|nr:fibronectin type III domain-containing protein [Erysipelotrichaceae bacterium]